MSHKANTSYASLSTHDWSKVQRGMDRLIQGRTLADLSISKQQYWIAVPVESAGHFDRHDIEWLVQALHKRHVQHVYAVVFEGWDVAEAIKVPSSVEGIGAINSTYSFFNVIMLAEDASWLCIATVDEYFIYFGLPDFIEDAIGKNITDQYSTFQNFATNPSWPGVLADELISVLDRCQHDYAYALRDTFIKLLKHAN